MYELDVLYFAGEPGRPRVPRRAPWQKLQICPKSYNDSRLGMHGALKQGPVLGATMCRVYIQGPKMV